jgi:hypothetical protein
MIATAGNQVHPDGLISLAELRPTGKTQTARNS